MYRCLVPLSLSFGFGYALSSALARAERGKAERTRATPPERRGACGPDSGAEYRASIPAPFGVALVLMDPCGKAPNVLQWSADRKETDL